MMRSAMMVCLALLVGCQSTPTRIAAAGGNGATTMPAGTAIVREVDGIVVTSVNATSVKRSVRFFPGFSTEPRYEVPAGPCTIVVELNGKLRAGPVTGGPKPLTFTALAGHSYTLHSRVRPKASGALAADQWSARLVDDAAFVAETSGLSTR